MCFRLHELISCILSMCKAAVSMGKYALVILSIKFDCDIETERERELDLFAKMTNIELECFGLFFSSRTGYFHATCCTRAHGIVGNAPISAMLVNAYHQSAHSRFIC